MQEKPFLGHLSSENHKQGPMGQVVTGIYKTARDSESLGENGMSEKINPTSPQTTLTAVRVTGPAQVQGGQSGSNTSEEERTPVIKQNTEYVTTKCAVV